MEPWLMWTLFGVAMWVILAGKGGCARSRRGRRSQARSGDEIARLKAELDASHEQIAALRARLEAVETIVTDEEEQLRREFDRLQRA